MSGTTYYQRNREVMLNRAIEYYENYEAPGDPRVEYAKTQ